MASIFLFPCGSEMIKMSSISEFYEVGEVLGADSCGIVHKCRDKNNGQLVAVKIIAIDKLIEGIHSTTLSEICLLKEMNHPNIVQLQDVKHTKGHMYMIFECLQTNLADFMKKYHLNIARNPALRRSLLKQILLGVRYSHENGIIHRDLKPTSLLVDESCEILKLAYFGYARALGIPKEESSALVYKAPELLLHCPKYSKAVDMWSVGIVFGEMVLHERLFLGDTPDDLLFSIFRLLGTSNEETWPGLTALLAGCRFNFPYFTPKNMRVIFGELEPTGVDLLSKMLCLNPSKRITAHDALEHEYFKAEDS